VGEDRVRVAAYALCRDDVGRILLCHISPSVGAGDVWTLPGGGLEFGESPSDAAIRELAEESGYRGEVLGLLDVTDRLFERSDDGTRLHAIRIVYEVRIVDGELRHERDGSTDMCQWVTPDEARRLALGAMAKRAVDRLDMDDRSRSEG
jgi:8-oxo-dGTP diphosphatase